MKSALDSIMYGSSWTADDAAGKRVTLYGPWHRLFTPAERRAFPKRDFVRVRRRLRPAESLVLSFIVLSLIAMAIPVLGAHLPRGADWGSSVLALIVVLAYTAHLLYAVPPDRTRFRRAMVAEKRCPSCARLMHGEFDAADAPLRCDSCGTVWRPEPPPARIPLTDTDWATDDDRGARCHLFDSPAISSLAAARLEITKPELKRLRKESSKFTTAQRVASVASSGLIGVQSLFQMIDAIGRGAAWVALLSGALTALCLLAFVVSFRLSNNLNRDMFRAAMLRRGRCPRCAYRIERSPRDPADNCTICPECGAAWKLPEAPPASPL
jgi:hypothetical protein